MKYFALGYLKKFALGYLKYSALGYCPTNLSLRYLHVIHHLQRVVHHLHTFILSRLQHKSKGFTLIDDTNKIKDTSVTTRNFVYDPTTTKDSRVYVLFPLLFQILTRGRDPTIELDLSHPPPHQSPSDPTFSAKVKLEECDCGFEK